MLDLLRYRVEPDVGLGADFFDGHRFWGELGDDGRRREGEGRGGAEEGEVSKGKGGEESEMKV